MRFMLSPEDILKDVGIYTPEDIDLELVAFSLGAEVKFQKLGDCEGSIVGTNKKAIITVNTQASQERMRFSLGHELGHWVNDKGDNLTSRCTANDMKQYNLNKNCIRQQKEVRANKFSAQLLIPYYLLKPYIAENPISMSTAKMLAKIFKTSVTSASIRVVETTEFPCMICCWMPNGERRWFIRSQTLDEEIWPLRKLINPNDTLTESDYHDVDGDKWLDGDEVEQYTIKESTFFNGHEWLSLLWWKDESQLQIV